MSKSYPLREQGTFLVVERTGWDRQLSVVADGKRLVGHAGAVLLRRNAPPVPEQAIAEAKLTTEVLRNGRN